jgi:hypothetical protein
MAIQGVPRFDAIQLMEIGAIRFTRGGAPEFKARGAFVNTVSGNTFGQTMCVRFSPETMLALQAFKNAIEQDLANLVFESTSQAVAVASEPGGIGEGLSRSPLSEQDVESV